MNKYRQQEGGWSLERAIIAFFGLAVLFAIIVYLIEPAIFTDKLALKVTSTERYPYPATLFVIGLVVFVSILSVGVMRHWRWLFWSLLLAFGLSFLQIPATLLQLMGILQDSAPVWYNLIRMGIAAVEVGIAVWMVVIYRRAGVWALGKKQRMGVERS